MLGTDRNQGKDGQPVAVSKRLRYEVLARDNSTCQTCGRTAPEVKLTIDHVVPQALGGDDEPSNLATKCQDCNNGKSSSSPDAPAVAAVAEDALRWSEAMQEAARQMSAQLAGDRSVLAEFDACWRKWTCGPAKTPIPRPDDWQASVTAFLAAGMPMDVLRECVRIAMVSKAAPEHTWRYMCGVTWRKVAELRELARELAGDPESSHDGDDGDEMIGADDWSRVILGQRDEADVSQARKDCLGYTGDSDEMPTGILWFVIRNLEMDRASLTDTLRDLLIALPRDVGGQWMRKIRDSYTERGRDISEQGVLTLAAQHATEAVELERAHQELPLLPEAVRNGLIDRARADHADIAEHLDEDYYLIVAARYAREADLLAIGTEVA